MKNNHHTRREFLKATSLGVAAIAMPSCMSTPGTFSETHPFTFAQICDTQLGIGGYAHDLKTFKQAVIQINALKPDFVVICGDLVHTPNERSFADFNKIKAEFDVPCYCVAGNHDVGNKPTRESLQYYREVIGKDYYSFEHKGYVFVFVNTQLWKAPIKHESRKHDSWLNTALELAADKNAGIFIVGHHPLFLMNPDEAEEYPNLPVAKRKELLILFKKQGVIAFLGGHTHKLIDTEYNGIQFVNGETTSRNFDNRPRGFRVWHIMDSRPFKHDFVPLKGLQEIEKAADTAEAGNT